MRRILPVLLCAALAAGCTDAAPEMDPAGAAIQGSSSRLTLGVNSFLWQASLNTLSFLPLVSADPFGGVIITDWYVTPSAPDERLKVTVYIMDRNLRADGLKVAVFRQTRVNGVWAEATPSPETAHKLEDAILTRARELRLSSTSAS